MTAQSLDQEAIVQMKTSLGKDPIAPRVTPDLLLIHDLWQIHRVSGQGTFVNPVRSATVQADRVMIEAVSTGKTCEKLIAELQDLGLTDPKSYRHVLNGWLPIASIRDLADLEHLRMAYQAYRPIHASGSVTSQGDTAQHSQLARQNFMDAAGNLIDGSGVRVCVISDSYDDLGGAADDIASGDLPAAGVINLDSTVNGNRKDEGRAMLQIVHDVAPGAELMFHTAGLGIPTLASHIMQLADSGCHVIVDDVIFPNDAMFMDGLVAQAAEEVSLQGVTYLTSAGNAGRRSYQAFYNPASTDTTISGVTYRPHDFDPGPGEDIHQAIKIKPGGTLRLSFQWDDPWYSITGSNSASTDTDVNIFLYKQLNGSPMIPLELGNIVNNNPPSGNGPWGSAWEVINWQNTLGTLDSMFNIIIGWDVDFGGPPPVRIKWIDSGSATNQVIDHPTYSSTVFGQQNAEEVMSVAAANWWQTPAYDSLNPPQLALYSSAGGTPIVMNEQGNPISPPMKRNRPNFTAPTAGNNTFFGNDLADDADTFPNFQGTSAAAPHAAGVAALIKQLQPLFTPDDIKATLENSAIDMGDTTGFDFDSGFGLINALSSFTALPVTMLDFKVRKDGRSAHLTWRTASEKNNRGFMVEMASDAGSTKLVSWQEAGWVPGHGNSAEIIEYGYRVHDLAPGTYYFRLKQYDDDGRFRFSDVRSLSLEGDATGGYVYFDHDTQSIAYNFDGAWPETADVQVFDSAGKLLVSRTGQQVSGGLLSVPFAGYPRGVYVYRIGSGLGTVSGKVHN